MHVLLDEEAPAAARENYPHLADIVAKRLAVEEDYEVDVSFLSPEEIRAINRDYREKDAVTDVISFAFLDDHDPKDQIQPFEGEMMLGTILICLDRAREQAEEIGNSFEREICFLFVHGLLHLLGNDHMTKEDEEVMFPLQREIMGEFEEIYGKL